MTTRTPAWRNASSSAGQSRSFPRLWRRPGFRARMLICSLSTAFREISRSTVCSVGDGVPSSPAPRNCSTSIPKEACERYRLVLIPVIHLNRESNPGRRRSYASKADRASCLQNATVNPSRKCMLQRRFHHLPDTEARLLGEGSGSAAMRRGAASRHSAARVPWQCRKLVATGMTPRQTSAKVKRGLSFGSRRRRSFFFASQGVV